MRVEYPRKNRKFCDFIDGNGDDAGRQAEQVLPRMQRREAEQLICERNKKRYREKSERGGCDIQEGGITDFND